MRISLNLIKKFTDIKLEEPELINRIAARIGEIERVEDYSARYQGIVVARIAKANPHPDADKLGVYQVDIGKNQLVQVVAGDTSLEPGDKVAYMPPGCIVPASASSAEPAVLEQRDLRGQVSNGMLASIKELDLGDDHSRVLRLETDNQPGSEFAPIYELNDTIIEIENKALTHRPDCFGHIGLAREIAGIQSIKFESPDWFRADKLDFKPSSNDIPIKGEILASEGCNRLTLSAYKSVKNGSSSLEMRGYLQRLGVRPLNSVVDLTNYIMLLTGQPIHAFDFDKLTGLTGNQEVTIKVRYAAKGEQLKLLNGNTVSLDVKDLVIDAGGVPVALAGVMGGSDTEVDMDTENLVIEIANFDMYAIRNTSMRHGLFTEAVTRFARGPDPHMCDNVQHFTADLLGENTGAYLATDFVDVFANPRSSKSITLPSSQANELLGTDYPAELMRDSLMNIEVAARLDNEELVVEPPTWRADLNIAADVIEEIGRLNGFENITPTVPARSLEPAQRSKLETMRRGLTMALRSAGAYELTSYSGVSSKLIEYAGQDSGHAFNIKNALSPDLEFMRLSLMPSLLEKVYPNTRRGFDQFAIYEFSATHHKKLIEDDLPSEQFSLALLLSATAKSKLAKNSSGAPYFMAARWLRYAMEQNGFHNIELIPLESAGKHVDSDVWLSQASAPFEPRRTALIKIADDIVGVVGEFRTRVVKNYKLPLISAGFELNLGRLIEFFNIDSTVNYRPLSRFPKVENDITLKTPDQVSFAQLESQIRSDLSAGDEVFDLKPLGIYKSDESEDRNITFRVWLGSDDRTLTTEEVNRILDEVVNKLQSKLGVQRV